MARGVQWTYQSQLLSRHIAESQVFESCSPYTQSRHDTIGMSPRLRKQTRGRGRVYKCDLAPYCLLCFIPESQSIIEHLPNKPNQ